MTQTVQYVVDLKGAQEAQRELDRLNVAFDKNNSAAMSMDKAIAQMERDIKDLNAAIAAGGPNVVQYKRALKDLQTQAAQGAAGTRNMGQAALEASRGLEDLQYGIGGVVNNIPSLVMAFGGGAGLTAAISLGAVAINQMAKNFMAVDPAAKEATSAAAEHVKGLRGEIEGLAQDLRALQVGAERAAMEMQGSIVEKAAKAASAALDPLGGIGRFERLKGRSDLPLTIKENIETAKKAMATLDDEMAKLAGMRRIQLEKESQRNIDQAVDRANAEEEAIGKARNGARDKVNAEAEVRALIAQQEHQDEMIAKSEAAYETMAEKEIRILMDRDQKISDLASAAFKKQEDERARNHKSADRARERENKKTLDAIAKDEKKHTDEQAAYTSAALSIVASASTQLVSDLITGQDQAFERMAATIMAQAGNFVVGEGIKTAAAGAGQLLATNGVVGGPAFVGGLALVGLGSSMGGVGAGWAASLTGAAGNTGGGSDDKRSRRDPGASPRRGGGGGDGGPVVLNLTYGAAGPLPEDTARLISRELRTGAKRAGR
jgi:hypothetical protein